MSHVTTTSRGAPARASAAQHDNARILVVLLCSLFFLEGVLFIPYVGIQNDEVLFAGAIYPPWGVQHSIRFFGHTFPTMLLSYVGTLKAWIYRVAVFSVVPPSPWSVRIPVLLIGAITIWMFFEFVVGWAGLRAALVATALLATDVTYILTTCLDWGPVVLQHFLLIGGALLLLRFHRWGKVLDLGAGFFLFGLGLWDKALFSWALTGLAAATAVVCRRALFRKFTPRNLAAAALGLVLGAAPLLVYNRSSRLSTVGENVQLSSARFGHKVTILRNSLEGSSLFGYIVRDEATLQPEEPRNEVERLSLFLSEATGHRQAGFLWFACILAFALLPWLWNTPARKTMLFALIFVAATWLQMALTQKGGNGAHHTVLLWPFPHLFAAAALAQISRFWPRAGVPALVAVTTLICGSNLLVLNEHFAQLAERGTTIAWTDAIYPLSRYLSGAGAAHVYTTDWGIYDALRALNQGRLPLELGADWFLRNTEKKLPAEALAAPGAIFVGHTENNEIQAGTAAGFEALAESAHLHKHFIKVIDDRNGRPIFEIFRFSRE
jgi:hypothetical protein